MNIPWYVLLPKVFSLYVLFQAISVSRTKATTTIFWLWTTKSSVTSFLGPQATKKLYFVVTINNEMGGDDVRKIENRDIQGL